MQIIIVKKDYETMKKLLSFALSFCLIVAALLSFSACGSECKHRDSNNNGFCDKCGADCNAVTKEPVIKNLEHSYTPAQNEVYVRMEITGYGTIDLCLDRDAAPITVQNFIALVENDFYNGLTLHRIIDGFVVQGGDPKGNGTGGTTPIRGEFEANGYDNPIKHERGVISMARRGDDYDSGSCQFFIVHETSEKNTAALDGLYASFGRVVSGMEVVDAIVSEAKYASATAKDNGTVITPPVIYYAAVLADGAK